MFLAKIKSHNYINGFIFSAIEFLIAAAVILPFFIYYLTHGRVLYAYVAGGLILNFLVIVFFAAYSIYKKEKSIGLSFYFDKEKRNNVSEKNPHLLSDTLVLCLGILIPFCLTLFAIVESLVNKQKA